MRQHMRAMQPSAPWHAPGGAGATAASAGSAGTGGPSNQPHGPPAVAPAAAAAGTTAAATDAADAAGRARGSAFPAVTRAGDLSPSNSGVMPPSATFRAPPPPQSVAAAAAVKAPSRPASLVAPGLRELSFDDFPPPHSGARFERAAVLTDARAEAARPVPVAEAGDEGARALASDAAASAAGAALRTALAASAADAVEAPGWDAVVELAAKHAACSADALQRWLAGAAAT
jgi:hypothetical protein